MLENLPGLVLVVARNGDTLFNNLNFDALPETSGTARTGFPPTPSKEAIRLSCRGVFESGSPSTFELGEPGPTGPTSWFACEAKPVRDANGELTAVAATCVDVTARRKFEVRAEQAVKKSEALLFRFLDQLPIGVFVVDPSGSPYFANKKSQELLGSTEGRVEGGAEQLSAFYNLYLAGTDQLYPMERLPLVRVLKGEKDVKAEDLEVRSGPSPVVLEVWANPIFGDEGRIEYCIAALQDVTLQKRQKNELERNLSLLRATLESTADGILMVDRQGKIESFNQMFVRLWGLPDEVIATRDDQKALASVMSRLKDPERIQRQVNELYEHPEVESYDVIEFKDGSVFERYSRPQKIDDRIVGRVWSFRDVTERELNKEKLQRYAERLRALADSSQALARARLDLPATLSESARKSVELLSDGCIIRLVSKDRSRLEPAAFHHSDPGARELIRELLEGTFTPMGEGTTGRVAISGEVVYLPEVSPEIAHMTLPRQYWPYLERFPIHSWIFVPLRAGDRITGVAAFFRDMTSAAFTLEDKTFAIELIDRASLAIDNAELYEEAKRAIQLREDFMSIASHELKTPLTPLKMQLQLLSHFFRTGAIVANSKASALQKLVGDSDQQIVRLTRLIEDMLDASRLRTGRLTLSREEVDLVGLVSEVIDRFRAQLASARCEIEFKTAAKSVRGDWDRLRTEQIVINLLSNAMKYGGGRPIKFSVWTEERNAVLAVQDFGIGIAKEDQERIFERFERAVSLNSFGGLGLGLYITGQIVEAHGGRITLKSAVGEGSTFTVYLPLSANRRV